MSMQRRSFWALLALIGLLITFIVAGAATNAREDTQKKQDPGRFEVIYRGLSPVVKFDVSPRLDSLEPAEGDIHAMLEIFDDLATGNEGPLGPQDEDGALQDFVGPALIPTPFLSFDGPSNLLGVSPPDPVGDVGPDHYVAMSNLSFAVYDKGGNTLLGPVPNNTLWAGFGGDCETDNSGDPIVVYDQLEDRWLLTQFTASGPTYFNCVALSQTGDPTGSYYRWAVSTGTNFPDYPKYGVWSDGYFISTREFNGFGPFEGDGAYAMEKADMLIGDPNPTILSFLVTPGATPYLTGDGLLPADLDGNTLPPNDSPHYFLGSMDDGGQYGAPQDALTLWEFETDWSTPANSSFLLVSTIPIAAFDTQFPCSPTSRSCIPQPGTTNKVDILSYRQRPIFRLAYRNFSSHEAMVTNQSVEASTAIGGTRWWELRQTGGGGWTLFQEGTYAPGTSDGIHRWMGSIAMDQKGNMALGYSASDGTSTFPSVWYTGRLAADPLGVMTLGEASIIDGTGSQTGSSRWGDYTSMNIDPVDDCTFWYVNQYLPNTSSVGWMLRIGAFKFDQCGQPDFTLSGTPASQAVCTPNNAVYQIDVGQVQNFTDPVTLSAQGNPAGTTTGFTVNPVTPPGSSDLTIGNTGAAAFGSYPIDVVGVAPTSTHTTTVTLDLYTALPGAPALVSPANGATGVSNTPTFTWGAVSQAAGYELEVATDAGFGTVVYTAMVGGTTHMAGTSLAPLTTHYWRVRATNVCGDGAWSTVFSFTTKDVPPILLVDDDDNNPDVQATYTDALDSLGQSYDVWDTANSDNEPSAAELAFYDLVIWFTGDEWGGFAGPSGASETALASWLDAGACLFISSQDYHFDRGLTSFMTGYLGLTNVTNDNGNYTSVTGQNVFAGLGPYTLAYPFNDFSDPITVGNGGLTAMLGNNSNVGGSSKETVDYKTSFWAFPWEALPGAGQLVTMQAFFDWCGLESLQPEIDVQPSNLSSVQPVGTVVTDTLTIHNLGGGILNWDIDEDNSTSSPVERVVRGNPERLGPTAPNPAPGDTIHLLRNPGDVIQDGGFEAGTPNPFWNEASTNFGTPLCTTASCGTGGGTGPHNGTWWAWFGGTTAQESGSVDQDVTIPSGTATLSFWLEIPSANTTGFLNVEIDNNVLATYTEADQSSYATYTQVVLDVSAYADGGTHNVEFSSTTDAGAGVLNFFVDDVVLDTGGGGAVACDAPEDIPWLSVSPVSGSTGAFGSTDVEVTYDSTGLSAGLYTAALCINSNDLDEPVVEVPVQLTVQTGYMIYVPIVTRVTTAGGQNVVQSPGFEAGTPNPFWNEASTNFGTPLCTAATCGLGGGTGPHGGSWWAWFGGISGVQESGSVDQTVTIPLGTATLTFWLEIPAADTTGFLNVEIDDNVLATFTDANQGAYATYTQVVLNVSAYADGGTHKLEFSSTTNPGGGPLNFFVDDVRLVVVP